MTFEGGHVGLWWGPTGFTTTTFEHTLKVGGRWGFIMHGPDGTDYSNRIVYTEIVRPQRPAYKGGNQTLDRFEAYLASL
ncbi:MAG TPA: SRPBCC domain-containing protein [Telluria sp.]|nr:SRPBCC domain-containing protein [Telluria sp.]